ncbi:unnamed protein product [Mytilus coruscus]|uniref:Integrase catalytic domain-containing protein n=1 Tax=Mytilus coruscus TaxID=42192 RepID=A0A6J8AX14_MYTCO|nr:unnamed protein product [Mytilus coruscus]
MNISDALSRAFLSVEHKTEEGDIVQDMICMISISKGKYSDTQDATKSEFCELYEMILKGWPDLKVETRFEVREYWGSRDQLSVLDGIIYKGLRTLIPPSMRDNMLKLVKMQEACSRSNVLATNHLNRLNLLQPLIYRIQWLALTFKSKTYILTVDYYSKYIDVLPLTSTNTTAIVEALKSIFATHGIPTTLRSDNGLQFSSSEFKKFSKELGIDQQTSSPHFQSANGEAERSIQTVKNLRRKSDDKHLSLLDYRTTPLEGINLLPSQLVMSRRPRNTLPASKEVLKPNKHNS